MITATRREILDRIAAAGRVRKFQLELTRGCNLRCVHCRVEHPDPGAFLPLSIVRRLMPDLRELGVFELNLTGGEILTHPQAFEMIEMLLREDFFVTIQTNATLFDERILSLLRERRNRINAISVSLYAVRPETHDAVTRTPDSHERTLRAMDALVHDGHFVVAASPQMRINADEFEALRALCHERGFVFRFGALITPGDGGGTSPLDCRVDDDMLRRLPSPTEALTADASTPLDRSVAMCPMGRGVGFVAADGAVRPCALVPLDAGNVHETPLVDIWHGSPVLREIREFPPSRFECSACARFSACRPCPGLSWLEHGSLFRAPEEICRITSAFLNKEMKSS